MTRYTIVAALAAAGLCGAAHAQSPRPDPWGDATVSRADEQKQAEERFDALDTDHDGSLSAKEQAAAQNQRGPGGGGLRRADTDGDGKIGKQEYVDAQLRRFDMRDADKDGQLTKAERDAARAQRMRQGGFGGGSGGAFEGGFGGPPPGED